jgi:hypothetical protein
MRNAMPEAGLLNTVTGEVRWTFACKDATEMARYVHWLTMVLSEGLDWTLVCQRSYGHGLVNNFILPFSSRGIPRVPGEAMPSCSYPTHSFYAMLPLPGGGRLPELVAFIVSHDLWTLAWPSAHEPGLFRLGWRPRPVAVQSEALPIASIAYTEEGLAECLISLCKITCDSSRFRMIETIAATEICRHDSSWTHTNTFQSLNEDLSYGGVPIVAPAAWVDPTSSASSAPPPAHPFISASAMQETPVQGEDPCRFQHPFPGMRPATSQAWLPPNCS